MALTEKTIVDQIEVLFHNEIQIRTKIIIEKDGNEISHNFHRHVVNPLDDISNESDKVKAIAGVLWTDKVKNDYKEYIKTLKH